MGATEYLVNIYIYIYSVKSITAPIQQFHTVKQRISQDNYVL